MSTPSESLAEDPTPEIVSSLMDALLGTLHLAFVMVRLNDPDAGRAIEMMQAGLPTSGALQSDHSIASARLGVYGENGIVVVGSQRLDFPTESDTRALDAAARQAGIALQQVQRLFAERRRSVPILDTIPGLVATLLPTGEVDSVNAELVEYCGQPLEAMKQWGTNGTVHSEDVPRIGPMFAQAIAVCGL